MLPGNHQPRQDPEDTNYIGSGGENLIPGWITDPGCQSLRWRGSSAYVVETLIMFLFTFASFWITSIVNYKDEQEFYEIEIIAAL